MTEAFIARPRIGVLPAIDHELPGNLPHQVDLARIPDVAQIVVYRLQGR